MSEPRDYLARLLASSRSRMAETEGETPLAVLEARLWDMPPVRPLEPALRGAERLRVIAEIRRASNPGATPSDVDVAEIARACVEGGASALSVVTEPEHFSGSAGDLKSASGAGAPVIARDYFVSPCQLAEARLAGADAVILLAEALGEVGLRQMLQAAGRYGLSTMIEVHDEEELEIATACGARIIGVNARDLHTWRLESDRCARLAPQLPRYALRVAWGGVARPDQVRALRHLQYDAVLVGEALVRAADPAQLLRELASAGG